MAGRETICTAVVTIVVTLVQRITATLAAISLGCDLLKVLHLMARWRGIVGRLLA